MTFEARNWSRLGRIFLTLDGVMQFCTANEFLNTIQKRVYRGFIRQSVDQWMERISLYRLKPCILGTPVNNSPILVMKINSNNSVIAITQVSGNVFLFNAISGQFMAECRGLTSTPWAINVSCLVTWKYFALNIPVSSHRSCNFCWWRSAGLHLYLEN